MTKELMRKNLVITIVMAIAGIAILYLSGMLFDFRIECGYSIPKSDFLMVIKAMGIIIVECATALLGGGLFLLGIVGIYNNTKKMR